MDRRAYLTGLTAVTVSLAGCESLPTIGTTEEDDETPESDPQQVQAVREYYSALNRGDFEAANQLIHPDSSAGEVSEEGVTYFEEEINISITDARLRTETNTTAEVAATVVTEQIESEQTSQQEWVFELRRADDRWQIYDATRVESTETPPPEQSESQVSNRVEVVSTVGTDIQSGAVQSVEMVVKQTPGAEDIDLSGVVLEWVGPSSVSELTYGEATGERTFTVESIQDENRSLSGVRPTLDDPADRALLRVDAAAVSDGGLAEGTVTSVTLQTGSGGTSQIRLLVPDTLAGSEAVSL